jgi:hypothetical protein
MNFDDLTLHYVELLIVQYVNKQRARDTVGVLARMLLADQIEEQIRDGFSLQAAVGNQLDQVAAYRGLKRVVHGLDLSKGYFAMPFTSDINPEAVQGFNTVDDVPGVTGYFLQVADTQRPIFTLTDDLLRRLTRLAAAVQRSFLSVKDIDLILQEFFGTNVLLVDGLDMTMAYQHNLGDLDSLFSVAVQTDVLPRPAGVNVSYA